MPTVKEQSQSLKEMLLARIETETDPVEKTEIMKRLELAEFMAGLVEDREKFIAHVCSEAERFAEGKPSAISPETLLCNLRVCLCISQRDTSDFVAKKNLEEVGTVLGGLIAHLWNCDADRKCRK